MEEVGSEEVHSAAIEVMSELRMKKTERAPARVSEAMGFMSCSSNGSLTGEDDKMCWNKVSEWAGGRSLRDHDVVTGGRQSSRPRESISEPFFLDIHCRWPFNKDLERLKVIKHK